METSHNIKLVAFGDLNTPTYYQLITINFLRIWAILPAGRAPRNLLKVGILTLVDFFTSPLHFYGAHT